MSRKRLKTQVLVNKLAEKQADAEERLRALLNDLRALNKVLAESDALNERITNSVGDLAGYSSRLQTASESDVGYAGDELRQALAYAKGFGRAVPKLKVEKFLRYWSEYEEGDEPSEGDNDEDPELEALPESEPEDE